MGEMIGGRAVKGRSWSLWTAAVAVLALAAMVLCALPSGAVLAPGERLAAVFLPPPQEAEGERVNINTADLETLMTLPDIGQVRGQAIIDYRAVNGPFRYPEELIYVSGIGEKTLEELLDLITTGGG